MGQQSRRKGNRPQKDKLAWAKANLERFTQLEAALARAYHEAKAKREEWARKVSTGGITSTEGLLVPVAPEAPETAIAPEAAASVDPSDG